MLQPHDNAFNTQRDTKIFCLPIHMLSLNILVIQKVGEDCTEARVQELNAIT